MKEPKLLIYGITLLIAFAISSCEQNNWIDWKVQNQLWLEKNKTNPNIQVTSTGLQYKVLHQGIAGSGRPNSSGYVNVSYKGRLIDGTQFDSGNNTTLSVSGVVAGFAEGLQKMNLHGDFILYIPADLGYGAEARGSEGNNNYIPPYSTLIFEVHLNSYGN